jgi:hypothetical protein
MNTMRYRKVLALAVSVILLSLQDAESQINRFPARSPESIVREMRNFGFLCGTITIAGTQTPLQGVELHLEGTDHTCRSSGSGDFSFGPVRPGSYVAMISLAGYDSIEWHVGVVAEKQTNISVEMVPDYSVRFFHQTGGLHLVISDRNSGYPEFADFEIIEAGRNGRTDLEGEYTTYNLPPGRYHIKARSYWHNASILDSVDIRAATLSTLFLGTTDTTRPAKDTCSLPHRRLPVEKAPSSHGGNILGIVRDAKSHEALRYVSVFIAPYGQRAQTDSLGRFRFMNLQPGPYCITLLQIGYPRSTTHGIQLQGGQAIFLRLELQATEFIPDVLNP